MPELPEVETMRRGIVAAVGRRIAEIARPPCRCRPIAFEPRIDAFRRRTVGRRIDAVDRLGKRVVIVLERGERIVIEPRMTGLVLLASPPDEEHLRLRIGLAGRGSPEILFWDRRGLGTVRLLNESQFAKRLGNGHLGPDALLSTPELLRGRLGDTRRAIKPALLDQTRIAGIGNLYASEILHLAAIHPARRCKALRSAEWSALAAAVREVLDAAILLEGSTLSDGTYRNALSESGGYQSHHRVYDKAGQPCGRCGDGQIVRIVQAQRATYFCPACQRRTKRAS